MNEKIYCQYWQSPTTRSWYFRIRANNHMTIAQSEGYPEERKCLKTANLFNCKVAKIQAPKYT